MEDPANAERIVNSLILRLEDHHEVEEDNLMPNIDFFAEILSHLPLSNNLRSEVEENLDHLITSSCTAVGRMLCSGPEHVHRIALIITFNNFAYVKSCYHLSVTKSIHYFQ